MLRPVFKQCDDGAVNLFPRGIRFRCWTFRADASREPERRTPMRLDGNCFTTSRIGVRRSDKVPGPDARPNLEVEASHEPQRRAGVSPAQRRRRVPVWPLRGQGRRDACPTLAARRSRGALRAINSGRSLSEGGLAAGAVGRLRTPFSRTASASSAMTRSRK